MNKTLPICAFEDSILATTASSAVTIITAETGAGKSTQVPQFLANAGYRVIVTQPRRLAASSLAKRVAEEMGTELGDLVGFRTAEERVDSNETQILFVTDGLQLVRELAGHGGTGRKTILVIDEVHEWNTNIDTLVAWTKSRLVEGEDLKVVLMSATMDADALSLFYGNAPVISVPGRQFPVERRHSYNGIVEETVGLAHEGRNVLVFQPGKKQIADTIKELEQRLGSTAIVLPLHGELTREEQQVCFDPPPAGKAKVIVATNVAQTSVTIEDIDAVVDSGIERRRELVDKIEGLYLLPISQADCLQRAGRAGRTKPGVYILCSKKLMEDRPAFPTAEILRSRLDQLVLRLAVQGFDATQLEFFHQPDKETLIEARRALIALGAMQKNGNTTVIGRRMARFPVSCEIARMLIEAEKNGVIEQVATIASCIEVGDIRGREGNWHGLTQERNSDLLAILDVWMAGKALRPPQGQKKAEALRDAGIFAKNFYRADELRQKILEVTRNELRSDSTQFASPEEERQAILKSCIAGLVDHLFKKTYGSSYMNGSTLERQLDRNSVILGSHDWLVGIPKDIEIKVKFGKRVLHLVALATAIEPEWMLDVAPQLVERTTGLLPSYNAGMDTVVSTMEIRFNGQLVRQEVVPDPNHPEANNIFCDWLASQMV